MAFIIVSRFCFVLVSFGFVGIGFSASVFSVIFVSRNGELWCFLLYFGVCGAKRHWVTAGRWSYICIVFCVTVESERVVYLLVAKGGCCFFLRLSICAAGDFRCRWEVYHHCLTYS